MLLPHAAGLGSHLSPKQRGQHGPSKKLPTRVLLAGWKPQPCGSQMAISWHDRWSLRPYSCSSTCGAMMTLSCCGWHCLPLRPLCSILNSTQCSPQPRPAQRGGSGACEKQVSLTREDRQFWRIASGQNFYDAACPPNLHLVTLPI